MADTLDTLPPLTPADALYQYLQSRVARMRNPGPPLPGFPRTTVLDDDQIMAHIMVDAPSMGNLILVSHALAEILATPA